MKIRFLSRTVTIANGRIKIGGFKNAKTLISKSFVLKGLLKSKQSFHSFVCCLFLPYEKLNKMFIDGII